MNVGTRERLATTCVLALIVLIATIFWSTYREVDIANRQRLQASLVARELSQLRLATIEYRASPSERTASKWNDLADRVGALVEGTETSTAEQAQILDGIRERRRSVVSLFRELLASDAASSPAPRPGEPRRSSEDLVFSQVLAGQQANFTDVFRLTDIASARINEAQHREFIIVLTGLALIATSKIAVSWLIHRDVLIRIAGLRQGAKQVAAGNWEFEFGKGGPDEIGDLTRSMDGMTRSLREAFAKIERSNLDLSAVNRELEAFSYSVSHDLRGPLRSMDGFALVLIEDYGDKLDAEGHDALMRIRAASQRMGAIIDDLFRLSQVTRRELEIGPVDLSALTREIADAIDLEEGSVPAQWDIEPGLRIQADLPLMRIAIQNLLQNARKFSARTAMPTIRVGASRRDGRTEYFVADNGVGFDMAHAANLFGAFQRLHDVSDFPGTGIGLAIVERVIRRHGGGIRAEAKEGEGATFFFHVKEIANGKLEQDHPAG
jgi:signal transduction histidine kinase